MEQVVARSNFGADALHPDGQYSRGSKWFHWLTVPPLVVLLLSGLTIRFISEESKMRSRRKTLIWQCSSTAPSSKSSTR